MYLRLFIIFMLFANFAQALSVEDEILILKSQLNALLLRRQEDYNLLEQSMKKSLEKNFEISALRNEIKNLRNEINTIRSEQLINSGYNNGQKNEHLTVQWLANCVSEIRGEITELAKSFNTSAELQQQQSITTDISILQNDIVTLRHDVEIIKAEVTASKARLSNLYQDVEISRQLSHNTAAITANLTDKLQLAISDWSRVNKVPEIEGKVYKRMVVTNDDPLEMSVYATVRMDSEDVPVKESTVESPRVRHDRSVRKQLNNLHSSMKSLKVVQKRIKYQFHLLEKYVYDTFGVKSLTDQKEFSDRIGVLEEKVSKLDFGLVNDLTKSHSEEGKLHSSVLELLESVESLESKFDTTVPDIRREISKLEFNLAQINSTTALLTEEQDHQKFTIHAMEENLSSVHQKLQLNVKNADEVRSILSYIEHQKIQEPKQVMWKDSAHLKNHGDWHNLVKVTHELIHIQQQFHQFIQKLPKDCSEVKGKSGLHLIYPAENSLMVVYCEIDALTGISYTVLQRRFNGQQEFNKNWEEYAKGFGSLEAEFWIGNEALHTLTKNNDTGLRVVLKDVSGNIFYAEYNEFWVASRTEGFKLHVVNYSGNASDALEYHNRMQFSTVDYDRDMSNTNCAANYEGGWWYSHCQHTNINGRYDLGLTWFNAMKNEWIGVSSSEIKLWKKK